MTNGQQVTLTRTLRMGANFTVRKGTVGTVIEAGARKHLVQFPEGQVFTANVKAAS
jgi:hypothetical protein